ncbi:hypothetical protein WHI96_25985 [Pseudonocardia tropica]|uniref:Integral membrane protein n=1 Tax=Pseudonocardia tropica TaxID=681289 RepID=A0ABV1K594_9PSEU
MTNSLSRVAAVAGVAAYTMSAALQVYRSQQGTGLAIDQFTVLSVVVYGAMLALSLALLTDRRWVWWTAVVANAAIFVQAPFVYWPTVYAARPLEVWDWLEGVWFTALLLVVVCCGVARIAGARLVGPSARVDRTVDAAPVTAVPARS